MVLIDSDVLIDVLRQDQIALKSLLSAQYVGRLGISVVSRMETVRGCLNREFLQKAERLLKQFEVIQLSELISLLADDLVTTYYLSNNLTVQDALIAATAITHGLPLLSKNQRDFKFIPSLRLLGYPTA